VERRDERGEKWSQCTIGPVRQALVVVGATLGAAAIWHRRHRRAQAELPAGSDPAEALRVKLAASKAAAVEEPPGEERLGEAPAPPESPSEVSTLDPETRRRAVHTQTRASMDQLGSADA
jgi:hypothetical protein